MPAVVAAVVVAAVLTGCSRGAASDETVALTQGAPASATSTTASPADENGNDADQGVGAGGTDDAEQTLPPGDPGADAPGTDDPNGDLGGDGADGADGDDDAAAKTTVPVSALLDTETVNSVAGAGWTVDDAPGRAGPCADLVPAKAIASRATVLVRPAAQGEPSSRLAETVSTHADRKAAIAAVTAIGKRLGQCAHAAPTDPRVGDVSVEATVTDAKGLSSTVTAVAVEGVSFVLSGSGAVTAADVWAALTDIAQGNSCEAAADGCH